MNALSSTTRTRKRSEDTRSPAERAYLDAAVVEKEEDAAAVVAAGVVGDDGNSRHLERATHGLHVALADVHAARPHEIAEHAGAAGDLGAHATDLGAEP